MVALEGRALSWFRWWNRSNPNPSWEGFKIAVVWWFQPSMIQNPFELLLSLKQIGSVKDYVVEFEKYVGALREVDPEFVKGIFLKGLREEIRAEVRLYELHSLSEVIQKTILVEQERRESEAASEAERAAAKGLQRPTEIAAPHKPNLDAAETKQAAVVAIRRFDLEIQERSLRRGEKDKFIVLSQDVDLGFDKAKGTERARLKFPVKHPPPKPPDSDSTSEKGATAFREPTIQEWRVNNAWLWEGRTVLKR